MEKQKQAQQHAGENPEIEKQIDSAMEKIIQETIGEEISKEEAVREAVSAKEEAGKEENVKQENENVNQENVKQEEVSKEEVPVEKEEQEENTEEKSQEESVLKEEEYVKEEQLSEEEPFKESPSEEAVASAIAVEPIPVTAEQIVDSEISDETGNAKKKLKPSMIAGAAAAILVVGYAAGALYYTNHLFAGSKINGMDCANMTEKKADAALKKQVESYEIELDFRNNESRTISGSDIGYQYIGSGDVKDVMKKQNPLLWVSGLFSKQNYNVEIDANFDKTALKAQLDGLDCLQEANMEAPADAQIAFVDNQFVIQDETQGTTIDEGTLLTALEEADLYKSDKLSVEKTGAYAKPSVTKDDETLIHQKDIWNS